MAGSRARARRQRGELAAEVLAVVAAAALTPREVMNRIDRRLAYTTMTTVLTRLHAKGLLGGSLLRLLP